MKASRYHRSSRLTFGALLLCAPAIYGCSAPRETPPPAPLAAPAPAPAAARMRLIIRFEADIANSAGPQHLQRLAAETGVTLMPLRPLFGGAYLFETKEPVLAAAKPSMLKRLLDHAAILSVEEDAFMQPQPLD